MVNTVSINTGIIKFLDGKYLTRNINNFCIYIYYPIHYPIPLFNPYNKNFFLNDVHEMNDIFISQIKF